MRTIEQLKNDFALYIQEIERCQHAKCYWALLHVLLALPDVCASLESPEAEVGDRYVEWCNAYLPSTASISACDRYQMRNALLHSGSTTAQNRGKKHHTSYKHFSFVKPDTFDVAVHYTTDPDGKTLNVHLSALALEMKQGLDSWFKALENDWIKMSRVEQNIARLARTQPKSIILTAVGGTVVENIMGWTQSST